ncbi:unnamed protein product [Ilex paraguariensis]|uniref:Uncharacterized protein n=1 Tax=Ilex paraguariensis TaxID=185542 RepID=A0ABC8UP60_9AQUA
MALSIEGVNAGLQKAQARESEGCSVMLLCLFVLLFVWQCYISTPWIGGGCGLGLGLGWGFGTAFGSQYRSSTVTFQGIDFDSKQDHSGGRESTDMSKGTPKVHSPQ